jgi:NTP pyrophosphatase (non-canonical NTP hydrolase)
MKKAIEDTINERKKQDEMWGEQNHDPITWSAILTEECGEFAQAALHDRFGGHAAEDLRNEAVQVAAVAIAIIECLDRNSLKVKEDGKP